MLKFVKLYTGSYDVTLDRAIIGTIDPVVASGRLVGFQYTKRGKHRGTGLIHETYEACRAVVEAAIAVSLPETQPALPEDPATMDKMLRRLIKNDDRQTNLFVAVFAVTHQVNSFQCRNLSDATMAARLIKAQRALRGLTTSRASYKTLLSGAGRNKVFGPITNITI